MKKERILFYFILLALLVIIANYYLLNQKKSQTNNSISDLLNIYINNGWNIIDERDGDLNGDIYPDKVIVLRTENKDVENDYLLTIMFGKEGGGYKISALSDSVIPCSECSGISGPPFDGIDIDNKNLIVYLSGGSADRWKSEETYIYTGGLWKLVERKVNSYNINEKVEPDIGFTVHTEIETPEDFREVIIDSFVDNE